MATLSSILAWRVPCTEEPGRLQSLGLHRIIHDRSDLACTQSLFAVILEPKEIKSVVVSTFPPLFAQSDGTRCLAFHIRYSAYKVNKQDDNIQP